MRNFAYVVLPLILACLCVARGKSIGSVDSDSAAAAAGTSAFKRASDLTFFQRLMPKYETNLREMVKNKEHMKALELLAMLEQINANHERDCNRGVEPVEPSDESVKDDSDLSPSDLIEIKSKRRTFFVGK